MAVDARVKYTKMIIEKSFIELLKVKPLNKITVKEICDLSEVNRSTFYKHYGDVFDLFEKMKNNLREDFSAFIQKLKGSDRRDALVEALEKIKQNKDFYMALLKTQSADGVFGKTLNEYFCEMIEECNSVFFDIPKERQTWFVYYLTWGSCGILCCWINSEMKAPVKEVAEIIENLIDNTLKLASE